MQKVIFLFYREEDLIKIWLLERNVCTKCAIVMKYKTTKISDALGVSEVKNMFIMQVEP